jgi:hypothetical protein
MDDLERETPRDAAETSWTQAVLAALDDAREHLLELVFAPRPDTPHDEQTSEAELRGQLQDYERGMADLFRCLRACGLPADALDWSRLKTAWRRAALDADAELTLRTALGEALYAAETTPLGEHAAYRAWAGALTAFLASRAVGAPPRPESDDARLLWAYERLADLEEHAGFQAAFAAFAGAAAPVVAWQAALLAQPRFDLVLNAAVRWLADAPQS